jgi:hypothetical protein
LSTHKPWEASRWIGEPPLITPGLSDIVGLKVAPFLGQLHLRCAWKPAHGQITIQMQDTQYRPGWRWVKLGSRLAKPQPREKVETEIVIASEGQILLPSYLAPNRAGALLGASA